MITNKLTSTRNLLVGHTVTPSGGNSVTEKKVIEKPRTSKAAVLGSDYEQNLYNILKDQILKRIGQINFQIYILQK